MFYGVISWHNDDAESYNALQHLFFLLCAFIFLSNCKNYGVMHHKVSKHCSEDDDDDDNSSSSNNNAATLKLFELVKPHTGMKVAAVHLMCTEEIHCFQLSSWWLMENVHTCSNPYSASFGRMRERERRRECFITSHPYETRLTHGLWLLLLLLLLYR